MRTKPTENLSPIVYEIEGIDNAVSSFSPTGYETLSAELSEYLDFAESAAPKNTGIVLELTGCALDPAQRASVSRAVDAHYAFRIYETRKLMRSCLIKTIWFAASFLLSSLLVLVARDMLDELLVQFLYLPFYFFGYRVLTFPLLDYVPAYRELKRLERLRTMQISFSPEETASLLRGEAPTARGTSLLRGEAPTAREASLRRGPALERASDVVKGYLLDAGVLALGCRVKSIWDLVLQPNIPGHEVLTMEMAGYFEQALPFVKHSTSVALTVSGCTFSEREQRTIETGIRRYYRIRCTEARTAIIANLRRVVVFLACLVLSSIALSLWGGAISIVGHEILLVVLWFFADYLVEFASLESYERWKQKKKWEAIGAMSIVFEG